MLRRYFKHPAPYVLALLFTLLYFALPSISQWIAAKPTFAEYAYLDASRFAIGLQKKFLFPFGHLLSKSQRMYLVFPYLLLLFLLLRALYLYTHRLWRYAGIALVLSMGFLYVFPDLLLVLDNDLASKSIGHVANGRIVNSKRMYFRGANFTTYSFGGYLLGRTHVNDRVRKIVTQSYEACETSCPEVTFVIGEIGSAHGGKFLPHRTHQNGLSVDFMSPLLKNSRPYRSNHLFNLWGYRHEFDEQGKKGKLAIDFESMAIHLYELDKAAKAEGLVIQKVIFDPVLRPQLLAAKYGKKIGHLPFTKNRVIIRHDDHYHVDFGIPGKSD